MPLIPHRLALAIALALTTAVLRDTQASPIGSSSAPFRQSTSANFSSLQADQGHAVSLLGASIDYTNHRDGEIQAITGNAIKVREHGIGRISNNGKITSERNDGIDLGAGVVSLNNTRTVMGGRHGVSTRHQGELINRGQINGLNGAGFHSAGSAQVINYGSLTGDATSLDADGDGIRIKGKTEIHNSGQIAGKSSRGVDQYGDTHTSEGIAIGGGTVFQYAKGSISGADHGIVVSDGHHNPAQRPSALENHGTIHGHKGFGVQFIGEQADSVINNGLIHGGNGQALDLGGGDDTLVVQGNSRFEGIVDGGTGYDKVILNSPEGGRFGDSRNFERLQVKQGTWTLTSQDDFSTGAEVLAHAHLINQGSILGATQVNAGATYGGGSVGHLRVAGTLEVDPRQGAARIKEHLTLEPGATLSYGIDADGNSATVEVGGTARLEGAQLYVLAANESATSRPHTVIKAGKLDGKFASISTNLALMTATAHYSPTQVDLTYKRNNVNLVDLGNTGNGQSAGEALNPWIDPSLPAQASLKPTQPATPEVPVRPITSPEPVASVPAITPPEPVAQNDLDIELADQPPADSPLRHALRYIGAAEAGKALDQLSGGSNAQLRNATLSGSRQVGSSLLTVLRQTDSQPGLQVVSGGHSRLWVQGLGNSATFDSTHGNHTLRQSTRGLLLGADWALDGEWRLGILGGQSQSDFNGQRFTGSLDSWHAGAYALRQSGPLALRLGAVYSSHSGKTGRSLEFNGYRDHLKGDYDANSQQAFAELGYTFGGTGLNVEPFAGLGYERYHRDRFKENGGEAALDVSAQTHGNLNSTFGLRVRASGNLDNKMSLTPRLSAGWKHLYGDVDSTTRQKLAVTDRVFKVKGAALDRDSLLLEAGLDLNLSSSQSLGVGYTGEVGGNSRNHGVMGQWRLTF